MFNVQLTHNPRRQTAEDRKPSGIRPANPPTPTAPRARWAGAAALAPTLVLLLAAGLLRFGGAL